MPAAFSRSFFFMSLSISSFRSFYSLYPYIDQPRLKQKLLRKGKTADIGYLKHNNIFYEKTQGFQIDGFIFCGIFDGFFGTKKIGSAKRPTGLLRPDGPFAPFAKRLVN